MHCTPRNRNLQLTLQLTPQSGFSWATPPKPLWSRSPVIVIWLNPVVMIIFVLLGPTCVVSFGLIGHTLLVSLAGLISSPRHRDVSILEISILNSYLHSYSRRYPTQHCKYICVPITTQFRFSASPLWNSRLPGN